VLVLGVTNRQEVCYTFVPRSGVVQLVARQPLELVILVRVQAPEPPTFRLQHTLTRDPIVIADLQRRSGIS
jgi:hypothetical protein